MQYRQLRALMEAHPYAEEVYELVASGRTEELTDILKPAQLQELKRNASHQHMHEMLLQMKKDDIHIMYLEDAIYPENLLDINDPPVFLYWRGDPDCLHQRLITMVGTRRASLNALEATTQIAHRLSDCGVSIVSGMAQGIDQASHKGCLLGPSPTVAVMACGLDVNYPAGSAELKKQLLTQGGILLSEYPCGMPAAKWTFPVRNRILYGLGRAVIMMECHIRSGSMSTVNHATNQGREVLAWPGIARSEMSEGAHLLLREGARYFTTAEDVLEDMHWESLAVRAQEAKPEKLPALTQVQRTVYLQLKKGEQSMDEIAAATGLDASLLSSTLTMLALMGVIRALPGKMFRVE